MPRINDLVKDFLSHRYIAVAGVSGTRETAASLIYRTLRGHGYEVYAVNPHLRRFLGDPCYHDLAALPEKPEGLLIVTRPTVAEDLVRQCIEAGIPRVRLHCMPGTRPRLFKGLTASIGSVSPKAVRLCRENGDAVPGKLRTCLPTGDSADDRGAGGARGGDGSFSLDLVPPACTSPAPEEPGRATSVRV